MHPDGGSRLKKSVAVSGTGGQGGKGAEAIGAPSREARVCTVCKADTQIHYITGERMPSASPATSKHPLYESMEVAQGLRHGGCLPSSPTESSPVRCMLAAGLWLRSPSACPLAL
jgi:hypothetical protein